jgi:chorismate dehydratase
MASLELSKNSPLRVGSVPYLVARPLNYGLENEPNIALEYAVPARLIERLRGGDLDIALVSSIELFRQPGYSYLAGLAVAGSGYVGSVQMFLKKPLEEVRTVALDPASRTAQALVQVLGKLDPALAGGLEFQEVPLGEDPRSVDCDAWLRIGDPALFELLQEGLPHYNPSEAWVRLTGMPFVFAAWIVRPGLDRAALEPFLHAFYEASARGTRAAARLAQEAAAEWSLDGEVIEAYLCDECQHIISPAIQARSLEAFGKYALTIGLASQSGVPIPIEQHSVPTSSKLLERES